MSTTKPRNSHRLTHIGLCVSDLNRSVEFYRNALGFEEVHSMRVDGPETAQLLGVPGLDLRLVYLMRDGMRIELLGYETPPVRGDGRPRAMNDVGFTHLSFLVDNVDELAQRIVAHGGRHLSEHTVTFEGGTRGLMLLDPDGTRLELIERVARPPGL
jgi:glyoxylase I family protein